MAAFCVRRALYLSAGVARGACVVPISYGTHRFSNSGHSTIDPPPESTGYWSAIRP
jgi:hypothetical protein